MNDMVEEKRVRFHMIESREISLTLPIDKIKDFNQMNTSTGGLFIFGDVIIPMDKIIYITIHS